MKKAIYALGLLLCGTAAFAQPSLPSPPTSPVPVLNFQYDAQGNLKTSTQVIGTGTAGFSTQGDYDRLNRLRAVIDAKSGLTTLDYDGLSRVTSVTDPRTLTTAYPRTGLGEATAVSSPDTGTATMGYDAEGNLLTRTDSRGVLASYSYDGLNRLAQVVYSKSGQPSQTLNWNYDQTGAGFSNGIGRLTSTSHANGSSQYRYDAQGRLTVALQTINAASGANSSNILHTVTYSYDGAGNVTGITYPSGRVASFTYSGGKPTTVSLAKDAGSTAVDLLTGIQFMPFGPLATWNWNLTSGPQAATRRFDTAGRLVRYPLGPFMRDLTYDAADRISAFTHYEIATGSAGAPASIRNQGFAYDELGRLTSVNLGSDTWSIAYDANGNRTGTTLNASTRTYTTDANSNRVLAVSNPATSYTYDASGNVTGLGAAVATYDLSGRWVGVTAGATTMTATFNALGQRVRKFTNAGSSSAVLFVYDQQGQLLGEYDSSGAAIREYVWLGNTPVAMFTPDGPTNPPNLFFIHTDHIDAPRVVVDRNGATRWMWMAEPFGTSAPEDNPSALGAFTLSLRFPGQYFDSETGTHYNYFRDYDPWAGRYLQSDPIGLAGGLNTYAYAGGNPASYTDPTGQFVPLPLLLLPVVDGIINTVLGGLVIYTGYKYQQAAANPDYSPWSPDPEKNKEFTRDRDAVNDVKPAPYKDPNKPTCDEIRERIRFLEDIVARRVAFTNKWYGGVFNPGHAGRVETLRRDIERLRARLNRGECAPC